MELIDFTVWDAPRFGNPRLDLLSTSWDDDGLTLIDRRAGAPPLVRCLPRPDAL